MIPGQIANLAMYVGTDFTISDTIFQADGVTPQNITGWNITFSLFAYGDPGTVFVTKTVAGGGIVLVTPLSGILQILLAKADTANMRDGQYEYSVTRTDAGFNTPCLSSGLFTLVSTATR